MSYRATDFWATVWFRGDPRPKRRKVYVSEGQWYVRGLDGIKMMLLDEALGYVLETR